MKLLRMHVLLTGLAFSVPASAYWATNHEDLNRQVYKEGKPWDSGFQRGSRQLTHAEDYLTHVLYLRAPKNNVLRGVGFHPGGNGNVIGSDTPDDNPTAAFTVSEWVAKGGLWEDGFSDMGEATKWGGRRAVNHFHDPLSVTGGGYTGITDMNAATALPMVDLLRRGISVTQWAMNGTSGGDDNGRNVWGYPTIGTSLHRAFTEKTLVKRTSALTSAFRAMGQVMHLVEDNTVPDHARDLPHPGDGWEEYLGRERPDAFGAFTGAWPVFPARLLEQDGLRGLWDRDVYNGSSARDLSGTDPPGLDEYVCSNFLAWNRLTKVGPATLPFELDFTTIPDADNIGFSRYLGLSVLGTGIRLNPASYPWPRTAPYPGFNGFLFETAPGSLPLSPAAAFDAENGRRVLRKSVWAGYVNHLMAAAHGYAQTVMSAALQPARAELITAQNGEFLELGVRLWNLWPVGGPHSVTWHVDEMRVVGLRPNAATQADALIPNDPITVPGIVDVPPGGNTDTNTVRITWKQRAALSSDSHAAVLVRAHLGDGDHQTPLLFSVPIPNAFPLVQQLTGQDTTPAYTVDTGNCDTSPQGCDFTGERGAYRNPLRQQVTGRIELLAARVDIRGRPADDVLVYAQREDARVAEVMLYAWSRDQTHQDYSPERAVLSTLNLTGTHGLQRVAPGHWVRPADAPDAPDTEISFTANLDLTDFYRADVGSELADAARAGGTVYIGVITTAGGFYAQRVMLWPLRHPADAQTVVGPDACSNATSIPRPAKLNEDRWACQLNQVTQTSCEYEEHRTQTIFADYGASAIQPPFGDPLVITLPLWHSDQMRPIDFMGEPVTLYGDAKLAMDCDLNAIAAVYPNGNGHAFCYVFGPNTLAYFASAHTGPASGTSCPSSTGLGAIPRVTYQRFYLQGFREQMAQLYNVVDLPTEWTAVLR